MIHVPNSSCDGVRLGPAPAACNATDAGPVPVLLPACQKRTPSGLRPSAHDVRLIVGADGRPSSMCWWKTDGTGCRRARPILSYRPGFCLQTASHGVSRAGCSTTRRGAWTRRNGDRVHPFPAGDRTGSSPGHAARVRADGTLCHSLSFSSFRICLRAFAMSDGMCAESPRIGVYVTTWPVAIVCAVPTSGKNPSSSTIHQNPA